jgi:hypothetical protein
MPDYSCSLLTSAHCCFLLQRGGRTTYFGPLGHESCQLISYLQSVPGESHTMHSNTMHLCARAACSMRMIYC